MPKRDLLFVGLVLLAATMLGASLLPAKAPAHSERRDRAPEASAPRSLVTVIDGEFRRQWAEEGVNPAPKAEELAVLRRLALALTGSIPSLEEIRSFEALPSEGRLSVWLDRMLEDRRYADYFAERLARAFVGTEGGPFILYRRRRFVTWLSDELFANRPYDQVVRALIADNGIWTDRPSTNFVTVTYDPDRKEVDPDRLAARAARAFLGLRIDCAQCHDHPFQPWKQRDFQGLAAYFGQVENGFTGIHDVKREYQPTNRKTGKPETVAPRVPFLPELCTSEGSRREQLARWVTHAKNPYLARATVNRVWALLFGRALVEPVDDIPAAGESPRVFDLLAEDFVANGYDLRRLIRAIAASEVFRLESATEAEPTESQERAWAVFPLTRLRPEQVAGELMQAASLTTIDRESHIIVRTMRFFGEQNFVHRYGDTGEDEFSAGCGTIPQRLLLMNGELAQERTKESILNAATRIGMFAADDRAAVETAYLTVLTRRPTAAETAHFQARLRGSRGNQRSERMTDLTWSLVNSTEFSWNH